jgi:SP family general alpha glucoside:H+ symporter-like MFS transporter
MIETTRLETELCIGASYRALFSGTNRRRTEIATVAWVSQALVGFGIQGYNVYFFTRAGLPPSQAYALGLGAFCIAFVGTATSWILISYLGRRTIFIGGLIFMIPIMSLIGFLDLAPVTPGIKWGQAGLLLTWFATYGLSIGPIPYVIAAETGATRLRMKTIAFARAVYYAFAVLNTVLAPYMFTQTAWNLRGKGAFPAAVLQLLLLVWSFFRLPECKGRTYEELDILFAKKLSARAFKGSKLTREDIDAFHAKVEAKEAST